MEIEKILEPEFTPDSTKTMDEAIKRKSMM